jgi:peptide/nickel transport system permease protein
MDLADAPFIKAQEARGLSRGEALLFHGVPNAAPPVLTLAALGFRRMLGGQIVCETVFSVHGLGKFALDSMAERDLPAVQGYVVMTALMAALVTLGLELASFWLDPRLRGEGLQ